VACEFRGLDDLIAVDLAGAALSLQLCELIPAERTDLSRWISADAYARVCGVVTFGRRGCRARGNSAAA
jgi:hypothetical protein